MIIIYQSDYVIKLNQFKIDSYSMKTIKAFKIFDKITLFKKCLSCLPQ